MNILAGLFSGGVGSVVNAVGNVVDDLVTSDEERGQIEIEKRKIALQEAHLADRSDERQVQVNLAEAQHSSMFVAGGVR